MTHQATRIKMRATRGSTVPSGIRTKQLSREVHRMIDGLASALGFPPNPPLRAVLAELHQAENATHGTRRMNWNPARAPLTLVQKRYLALGGLYCVMQEVAEFERTDRIVETWLAFRDSARTAAARLN
jgi:hypothetical protein